MSTRSIQGSRTTDSSSLRTAFVSRFVPGDSILVGTEEDKTGGAADVFEENDPQVLPYAAGLDPSKARSYSPEDDDKDDAALS